MQLVIMESPYAGDSQEIVDRNIRYARACMLDCLKRGEAPMVSHLLYTLVLDDTVPEEREMGINAGLAWRRRAPKTIVYTDLGISTGMKYGIAAAEEVGNPVEYRRLNWTDDSLAA